MPRRTRMLYRDVNDRNNEPTIPYQAGQLSNYSQQPYTSYPPVPPRTPMGGNKNTPNGKPSKGIRTGAIIALVIVLVVVFGTGLFAGWQLGRTSSAVADQSAVGSLQSGNNAQSA